LGDGVGNRSRIHADTATGAVPRSAGRAGPDILPRRPALVRRPAALRLAHAATPPPGDLACIRGVVGVAAVGDALDREPAAGSGVAAGLGGNYGHRAPVAGTEGIGCRENEFGVDLSQSWIVYASYKE